MAEENGTQETQNVETPASTPDPGTMLNDIGDAAGGGGKGGAPNPDAKTGGSWKTIEEVPEDLRERMRPLLSRSFNEGRKAGESAQRPDPENQNSKALSRNDVDDLLKQQRAELTAEFDRRDQERNLRDAATARFRKVLRDEGIAPGSEQHDALVKYYSEEKAAGRLDGRALMTEAGIRSVILASGAKLLETGTSPSDGDAIARLGEQGFGALSGKEKSSPLDRGTAYAEMDKRLEMLRENR